MDVFGIPFWRTVLKTATVETVYAAVSILKILTLFFMARVAARGLIDRVFVPLASREPGADEAGKAARVKTLQGLLNSITGYVLVFVAGVMILRAFKVDPVPVLTAAGVVGLAVGFGAQKLVRDVISGFFILLENQFSIGEYVTIGPVTGTIQEIGMRMTSLRDDAGKLWLMANGDITQVCNHSRGTVKVSMDVNIAADCDVQRATELLNEAGRRFAAANTKMASPFAVTGFSALSAAATTIRMEGVVNPPGTEEVQLQFRREVTEALAREGIRPA